MHCFVFWPWRSPKGIRFWSEAIYLSLTLISSLSPSRLVWQLLPWLCVGDEGKCKEKNWKLQTSGNRWRLQHQSCCVSHKYACVHVCMCACACVCVYAPPFFFCLIWTVKSCYYDRLAKLNGKKKLLPNKVTDPGCERCLHLCLMSENVYSKFENIIITLICAGFWWRRGLRMLTSALSVPIHKLLGSKLWWGLWIWEIQKLWCKIR